MTSSRGAALLWVLVMIALSLAIAGASLAVSRMAVTTSVSTLERADGLFYAEAAAELAVSHIRQNSDMHGRLVDGAARALAGDLPGSDVSLRFEADLSEFNSSGDHARSILVRVWPDAPGGVTARPFVARASLRSDLSVGEWFVLDYEPRGWETGDHDLPKFTACSAATPRVTDVWGQHAQNNLAWAFEENSARPDEVRVSWRDFRRGREEVRVVPGEQAGFPVTTPLVSSPGARPERVEYRLEALFDGRVVDACVVEVVSGRAHFDVSPTRVCAAGDTVQVVWDVNAGSGVQVRLRESVLLGSKTTVLSSSPVGSLSVPIPAMGLFPTQLELVAPADAGGTRSQVITRGC